MTPVEERIDSEAVRGWIDGPLSEWIKEAENAGAFIGDALWAAQRLRSCRTQMLALLTEHSARETLEWLEPRMAAASAGKEGDFIADWLLKVRETLALPATEPAQPEEDRTEAWIHSPERESPPVEAEEEG